MVRNNGACSHIESSVSSFLEYHCELSTGEVHDVVVGGARPYSDLKLLDTAFVIEGLPGYIKTISTTIQQQSSFVLMTVAVAIEKLLHSNGVVSAERTSSIRKHIQSPAIPMDVT